MNLNVGSFYKKRVKVEAVQITKENIRQVYAWIISHDGVRANFKDDLIPEISIVTLEGTMSAEVGDYIIKGIAGEFYPCKEYIFTHSYDVLFFDNEPDPKAEELDFNKDYMLQPDPELRDKFVDEHIKGLTSLAAEALATPVEPVNETINDISCNFNYDLTDTQLRVRCIEIAAARHDISSSDIVVYADSLYRFIKCIK